MIQINGKEYNNFDGKSIEFIISFLNYKKQYIAIEVNKVIVKKELYGTTFVNDGDCIEVVSFVGGG